MFTFKACKHNCEVTIAIRQLVCIDANIRSIKSLKCPKNEKHEFHAIVYAKETHVIYVHATL
jgi:hypothetical protein